MLRRCVLIFVLCLFVLPVVAQEAQAPPQWDGSTRFTVLVLGIDRRPSERIEQLNFRSDTVMLISIDPTTKQIGILSIPRDMHFALTGTDELVRVNSLLVRGENRQAGYGPVLALETLQNNLGMYIDGYLVFDFQVFTTLIDAIGGIDIELTYNISDPTYPDMNDGFDPFFLNSGQHHLDGETALKFSRTRHGDNDYLRGQRQLQVVAAIREQLSDPLVFQELIGQASTLVDEFEGNVFSNLTAEQMMFLGITALSIPADSIQTGALNEAYSYPYGTTSGTVRVPDREKLVELLSMVFGANYSG